MARSSLVGAALAAASAVLVTLLLLVLVPPASAGDWRGRPHRLRAEGEYHLNHEGVPLLGKDKLPESFSWANARGGRHLLVRLYYFSSFFSTSTLFFFFLFLTLSTETKQKLKQVPSWNQHEPM